MKVSRDTLQTYFADALPTTAAIADAFTFHCFEIEEVDGDVLDIKVLPNRAADCKSEEGIARELSSILSMPLRDAQEGAFSAPVTTSLEAINGTLGAHFTKEQVLGVFGRLRFKVETEETSFTVCAPLPRTDITIPEDVAEEVARIIGFDAIEPIPLPPLSEPADQNRFNGIERMKDQLVQEGFTEVSTQSFAKEGAIYLANALDSGRPALRTSLIENIDEAVRKAKLYAPLLLGPGVSPKVFEVGSVFPESGEFLELRMSERVPAWGDVAGTSDNLTVANLEAYGASYEPKRYTLGNYQPFSLYPFITRDIALWVPGGIKAESVAALIEGHAGPFLARVDAFDHFEKENRISYAFRLVFQAMDKTLTDEEVNTYMEAVGQALAKEAYEVR